MAAEMHSTNSGLIPSPWHKPPITSLLPPHTAPDKSSNHESKHCEATQPEGPGQYQPQLHAIPFIYATCSISQRQFQRTFTGADFISFTPSSRKTIQLQHLSSLIRYLGFIGASFARLTKTIQSRRPYLSSTAPRPPPPKGISRAVASARERAPYSGDKCRRDRPAISFLPTTTQQQNRA